jgi:Na+/melibiose symporter-like transporter
VGLLNVPVAAIGLIGVLAVVPETRDPVKRPFDIAGGLLSTVGLLALVFGIIRGGRLHDWVHPQVLGPIVAGLAMLVAFVAVELRLRQPSFDIRLFRNRSFAGASWAVMLTFFGLLGAMFFSIFYLQGVRALSPLESGLVLLPVGFGVLIGAPASEPLVRRFGVRTVTATALSVVAATFLAYTLLGTDTPLIAYCVLIALQGLGMGAVAAPTTELIMASLPRERSGAGAAINNAMRHVGGVLGVAVLGSILFTSYRDRIGPALDGVPVPEDTREAASVSAEATRALGDTLGLPDLTEAANQAYLGAMDITAICSALAAMLGVLVLLTYLRPARSTAAERDAAPILPAAVEPDAS